MGGRSRNSRKKYRKAKPQRILIRCGFLVGAGGCREPRRKGTRVAAPSGCIVPWAARASCWPQPQQLLPVSAAGSGRRCCTGAFPRRTIRRVDAVRIHPCSPFSRQIKQKLQYPVRILEFLVGAGGFEQLFFRPVCSFRVRKCSIQATFRARHGTRDAPLEQLER